PDQRLLALSPPALTECQRATQPRRRNFSSKHLLSTNSQPASVYRGDTAESIFSTSSLLPMPAWNYSMTWLSRVFLVLACMFGLVSEALGQKGKTTDDAAKADADAAQASEMFKPNRTVVFKTIQDVNLHLHIFDPPDHKPGQRTPAIVFFFGG